MTVCESRQVLNEREIYVSRYSKMKNPLKISLPKAFALNENRNVEQSKLTHEFPEHSHTLIKCHAQ